MNGPERQPGSVDTFNRAEEAKEMEHRLTKLENQLKTLQEALDEFRAHVMATMATKDELKLIKAQIEKVIAALRLEMFIQITQIKEQNQALSLDVVAIKAQLPQFATKADLLKLKNDVLGWVVGIAAAGFMGLAGMQFTFYNLLKADMADQIRAAIHETTRSR